MSNNPLRHPFVQNILKGNRNRPTPEPVQRPNPMMGQVEKRYISLRVYPAQAPQDEIPMPVDYLEAGGRYRIVLQCDMDKIDDSQKEVTINGPFTLTLKPPRANGGISPFALTLKPLYFDRPFTRPIEIPFELPQDDCPTCSVTLSVIYISGENVSGPVADARTLKIQGNCVLEDAKWLSVRYIAVGVPKNIIVLSAEPINAPPSTPSKKCQIAAWNHYCNDMFSTTLNTSGLISVADSMKNGGDPVEVLLKLRDFSYFNAGEIMKWLKMVKAEVKKRGKQLGLIIFDSTDFEIPWELLEIEADQYLGAVAHVARWLHLTVLGEARFLTITDYTCEGSVLSYLDPGLEGSGEERALLQTFLHSDMSSLEELQQHLEEPLQDMGLLYIGSHGGDGTHLYSSLLSADTQSPASNLRASWLLNLPRQPDPRPTLFINACESARILYKRDLHNHTLVKNFLLLCASNYIGTIARVDSSEAPLIARRILELAQQDEGVQIVELLCLLRTEAVEHKRQAGRNFDGQQELAYREQKRKAAAQLLNTFSYVYYGNPLARLRLRPAQQDTREEGA